VSGTRPRSSTRISPRRRGEVPPEQERTLDVRRLVRIGLAVLGVAAITIGIWVLVPDQATYGGPLQDPNLPSSAVGAKRGAGKPISVGLFLPWNVDDEDAVLDRLVPLSPSVGIEVVDAGVLPPEVPGIGAVNGWPPEGMTEPPPVHGFVVPPGEGSLDGYQIVVGVRAAEPGVHTIPGFEVRYRVGGADYRAVMLQGVWICVPRQEKPACPGKGSIEEQQQDLRASLLPLIDAPSR
jgi:hypothetical protein